MSSSSLSNAEVIKAQAEELARKVVVSQLMGRRLGDGEEAR